MNIYYSKILNNLINKHTQDKENSPLQNAQLINVETMRENQYKQTAEW